MNLTEVAVGSLEDLLCELTPAVGSAQPRELVETELEEVSGGILPLVILAVELALLCW